MPQLHDLMDKWLWHAEPLPQAPIVRFQIKLDHATHTRILFGIVV